MEQYYHGLVRYLTTRLRDRHLAADVAHDAYIRVLERADRNGLEYPQAFLYRTAINLSVDLMRRDAVRRRDRSDSDDEGLHLRTPQASLYQLQRVELVERALLELPEKCRRAFLLRKLEGHSHQEIASLMGISKDMVEKHIVNAMKHCRIRVKEMEYSKADA